MIANVNVIVFLTFVFLPSSLSVFTVDFKAFLTDSYGEKIANRLERKDLGFGKLGSFGGKKDKSEQVTKQPIIFVHGLTQRAGFWIDHFHWFSGKSYSSAELYATSYGDGGLGFILESQSQCESMKQVRRFIIAVNNYTNSKVDVIGHSLGGAVSRKAILGGKCVDTGEDLGEPLTALVDTFISLAGVAYGSERCPWLFLQNCNEVSGFDCKSELVLDINKPSERYEGEYSYYIYSHNDHIIGDDCCGHFCPELKNATDYSEHFLYNHFNIVPRTVEIQYEMLTNHVVTRSVRKFLL